MEYDLTVILCTTQTVPQSWFSYFKETLLKAAEGYPIIVVSKTPLEIGTFLVDEPHVNSYYWQMLRAAKMAQSKYIAIVEDDCLYTQSHFREFRPSMDAVAYNMHRWSLFTWGVPHYSWKPNWAGAACIAPRLYFIDALNERFAKYPNGMDRRKCGEIGYGDKVYSYERVLGLPERNKVEFYSTDAMIQFNHDYFSTAENTPEAIKHLHKKRMGLLRSMDIPYWGRSEDLVKKFK